jgi:hypothetical protein
MKPAHGFTQSRFDLIDAFTGDECAICALSRRSVERYFAAINYDSVNDPGVRRHFVQAGGFCNVHAYQWLHAAFVLGTASLYRELLEGLLDQVRSSERQASRIGDRVGRWFGHRPQQADALDTPKERCPACAWLAETELMLVGTLVDELPEPAFRKAFEQSTGLCFPHLRLAMRCVATDEAFARLRDKTVVMEKILIAQLGEIMRKHDYRFRDEPDGDEVGAAARAVAHVTGFCGLTTLADMVNVEPH